MNSEIRTFGRTAFGAPLEFLFTKRRINDKMQFVGAIQSLDTPRSAGSVFDTGHVRRGRARCLPTLSAGLREDFHWDFPSSESKSVVSGVKKERTQCQFHLEVELSGARNGRGGGVDGHRSIAPQTTNLSTEINCFFMRARPQRKEEDK